MRRSYHCSVPDASTSREQEITRLTCLRLYREFADECRHLARFAQTLFHWQNGERVFDAE